MPAMLVTGTAIEPGVHRTGDEILARNIPLRGGWRISCSILLHSAISNFTLTLLRNSELDLGGQVAQFSSHQKYD